MSILSVHFKIAPIWLCPARWVFYLFISKLLQYDYAHVLEYSHIYWKPLLWCSNDLIRYPFLPSNFLTSISLENESHGRQGLPKRPRHANEGGRCETLAFLMATEPKGAPSASVDCTLQTLQVQPQPLLKERGCVERGRESKCTLHVCMSRRCTWRGWDRAGSIQTDGNSLDQTSLTKNYQQERLALQSFKKLNSRTSRRMTVWQTDLYTKQSRVSTLCGKNVIKCHLWAYVSCLGMCSHGKYS